VNVFFELTVLGDVARMAAVDEATGTEAVVVGPARAARSDLEALALRKLERLLEKRPAEARRGKLV
jgi:hypothetical protein